MSANTITNELLDHAHNLVRDYLQECYDNLPMSTNEQNLALAATGLIPTGRATEFLVTDENPNAQAAWVLATCWFLKLVHPDPIREAGRPLYQFLDHLELQDPGAWAQTHNDVAKVISDAGHEIDDFRQS